MIDCEKVAREVHGKIINLPLRVTEYAPGTKAFLAYKIGHRDARHDAAEIVLAAICDDAQNGIKTTPCGGCGETNPRKRCLGCLHDFEG